MPRLKPGEATCQVSISLGARMALEHRSEGMGRALDSLISRARGRYKLSVMAVARRDQPINLIVSETNHKWLKEFSGKANIPMAELVEKLITDFGK